MVPSIEQIKKGLAQIPIHPTTFKISQGFGLENTWPSILHWYNSLGMLGHNGIDYSCPTRTVLKAPIDFTVSNFYNDIGYGIALWGRSKEFAVDGKIYCVELVFGHLKDFVLGTNLNKKFLQGEDCAISNNTGQYTTGAHLHLGFRINEKTSVGGWVAINKNNGYKGYFNQLLLMTNDMIETIKFDDDPKIYAKSANSNELDWIGGWGSYQHGLKRGWFKPHVVLTADKRSQYNITGDIFGIIK